MRTPVGLVVTLEEVNLCNQTSRKQGDAGNDSYYDKTSANIK